MNAVSTRGGVLDATTRSAVVSNVKSAGNALGARPKVKVELARSPERLLGAHGRRSDHGRVDLVGVPSLPGGAGKLSRRIDGDETVLLAAENGRHSSLSDVSIGSYRVDKNRPVVRRRLPDIPIQHAYANTISHNMELSQLRDQNEHLGQIIKSLTDRVDDLTQMVTRFSPAVPVDNIVEEESLDKTAQLVAQLQSLTDRVSKKQRTRAPAQQIIDQMSVPGDNDTDVVCLRQYMRPTKFDGSSPFETFLAHFKNCAEHNHWTDTEKLSWLKGPPIKNAGQALWDSTPSPLILLINWLTFFVIVSVAQSKQINTEWSYDIVGGIKMKL
jgi:hypothetical protein